MRDLDGGRGVEVLLRVESENRVKLRPISPDDVGFTRRVGAEREKVVASDDRQLLIQADTKQREISSLGKLTQSWESYRGQKIKLVVEQSD
jgi:hypothetical protein